VRLRLFWNWRIRIRAISIKLFQCIISSLVILRVLASCIGGQDSTAELVIPEDPVGDSSEESTGQRGPQRAMGVNCISRPDPADCCETSHQDCGYCRFQMQAALEKWRQECLPNFEELRNCGPGVKISTCCGGDRDECVDCRMKALDAMIGWRQKCGVPEGKECDKADVEDQCCTEGAVLCEICRARVAKLSLERQRQCGVKNL
jgi:hypothetical protein